MASKNKTVFCCSECGNETIKWSGKCPACGAWNSLVEIRETKTGEKRYSDSVSDARALDELEISDEIRYQTGIPEFDRVLGGGAVKGSLILVGGAPGVGKSTLLLQLCRSCEENKRILYVSGEESGNQLKMRAQRLAVSNKDLYVLAETDLARISDSIKNLKPDIVIIDSIQTVYDADVESTPGSISQIRECTMKLMRISKEKEITVFIVGHINKDGNIAGPKILEHMVDCVLYFEGEKNANFRILRAAKNRFGSTNEIGVFEMTDKGLICIDNPSAALLEGRPENSPGTCVTCVIEGTRPILAEIQALVSPGNYNPSRRSNGIDYNRAAMLLAVLDKRGGVPVSNCDAYINVIGGLDLDDPAADLATVLAISSSFYDIPLGKDLSAIGEVGLSGEVRNVSAINQRLSEIARLGFNRCIVPSSASVDKIHGKDLELIFVRDIKEAVQIVMGK
ncbi:MAG: DNA repair protein RadA [Oscillospiraceae bacterium]|nr:DNA repair protein RadA [Oscillospiraceae bacterium]